MCASNGRRILPICAADQRTSVTSYLTVMGQGSCTLRFFVVGGGGEGYCAGGGAGYVKYKSLKVSPRTMISAEVGDRGQASTVTIVNGDTVTANQGGDRKDGFGGSGCSTYHGGDGYSGGGFGGQNGGSNGGNGGGDLLPREAAASARSRSSRSSANALSRGEMSIIGEVEAVLEAALKIGK